MEASTATGRHSTHPVSYYWEMVKDMDDSQKLELVSIIIDSVKPAVAKSAEAVHHYLTQDEVFHHKESVAV